MDVPAPPDDPELKNIIDKLANFVARNGPEFEQMTKHKQEDNPRFTFLFGGENYLYYQYRVNTERATAVFTQQPPPNLTVHPAITQQPPPTLTVQTAIGQQLQQSIGPLPAQQTIALQPLISQQTPLQTLTVQPAVIQPVWSQVQQQQNVQQLSQQIQQVQQQIQQQQQTNAEQIQQSEQNLSAQFQSMTIQQQTQIEEAILKVHREKLEALSMKCKIDLDEIDRIVQPIVDSCTKDAISNGKNWVFINCSSDEHYELIAQYLFLRVTSQNNTFETRLHLIYLMNDLLHHCQRKHIPELKAYLAEIVVPIFCTSSVGIEEEKKIKLSKLLNLWEQNSYFSPAIIQEMKDPEAALTDFQTNILADNASIVTQIGNATQQQYSHLQQQHQEFTNHLSMQLQQLQQQLQQLQDQLQQSQQQPTVQPLPAPAVAATAVIPGTVVQVPIASTATVVSSDGQLITTLQPGTVTSSIVASPDVVTVQTAVSQTPTSVIQLALVDQPTSTQTVTVIPVSASQVLTGEVSTAIAVSQPPPQPFGPGAPPLPPPQVQAQFPPPALPPQYPDYSQPPPGFAPPQLQPAFVTPPATVLQTSAAPPGAAGSIPLPDMTKPPPGFPAGSGPPPLSQIPLEMDLTPTVPYYELPAGLMAPLVKLEDSEYKPLDPRDIRLPPPCPPSERLLAAVEAFYAAPSHERPRDSEGWEKLALYEYFKAKQKAKKLAEREQFTKMFSGARSRSRSPSPRKWSKSPPPRSPLKPGRRSLDRRSRSRSRSRSPSPVRQRPRERSDSRSRSRSRSRSKSPLPYQRSSKSPSPARRLNSSPSPFGRRQRSPSPVGRRQRSDSPVNRQQRSPLQNHPVSSGRDHQGSESPPSIMSRRGQRHASRSPTPPGLEFRDRSIPTRAKYGWSLARGGRDIAKTGKIHYRQVDNYPMSADSRLGLDNKGHQLLMKMGWGGKGLGAAEQGRLNPVEEAEVRDKTDLYKGVGMNMTDPFEQFRKHKSAGFIERMKAAQEVAAKLAKKE